MESRKTRGASARKAPLAVLEAALEKGPDEDGVAPTWTVAPARERPPAATSRPSNRDDAYKTSPVGFLLIAFVLPLALVIGAAVLWDLF